MKKSQAGRITIFSFIINTILSTLKLAVGFMGNSGALVADGVHSLSDLATDVIVYISLQITKKPADEKHNYGHGKVETVATVLVSMALFIAGFSIGKDGITKIIEASGGGEITLPSLLVVIVAGISLVVKETLFHFTINVGRKEGSDALIANAWHQRSDAMSSLGVLIGVGGALLLGTRFAFLDSVAQVIVSIFIFRAAYKILVPNLGQLVDASLDEEKMTVIRNVLEEHPRVKDYHHLRTRRIGNINAVDVHVLVDSKLDIRTAHDISTELELQLKAYIGIDSLVSIHIEPNDENQRLKDVKDTIDGSV
ncbi:MAG TPA: cation diffusion facilitator family transporter [Clostridia bacterium]|nr:cation diffusion facilitator family transporter [Clostridia bacterium]HPQ47467.1 cation diffusion facilitator family transporter [Clostridia bacterium]